MKYQFTKPYTFEDKEYTEIEFDLSSMTGRDISAAKKEYSAGGNYSPWPTADYDFCAILLARVAKLPLEFFMGLPAPEFCRLTQTVSNFLIVSD